MPARPTSSNLRSGRWHTPIVSLTTILRGAIHVTLEASRRCATAERYNANHGSDTAGRAGGRWRRQRPTSARAIALDRRSHSRLDGQPNRAEAYARVRAHASGTLHQLLPAERHQLERWPG